MHLFVLVHDDGRGQKIIREMDYIFKLFVGMSLRKFIIMHMILVNSECEIYGTR